MEKISFKAIEEMIKNESKKNLSPGAVGLYIGFVFNEFQQRVKRGSQNDMSGFILEIKSDLFSTGSNEAFEELNASGLIQYSSDKIHFYPLWMKYVQPDQFSPFLKTIGVFKDDLINGAYSFKEMTCRSNRINMDKLNEMILRFCEEQEAVYTTYHDFSAVIRHCGNWIKKRLNENKTGGQTNFSNKL